MIPSDSNQNAHIPSLGWLSQFIQEYHASIHLIHLTSPPTKLSDTFSWRWKPVIRYKQSGKDLFMFICFEEIYSCSPSILQSGKMCQLRAMPRNAKKSQGVLFSFFFFGCTNLGWFSGALSNFWSLWPKTFATFKRWNDVWLFFVAPGCVAGGNDLGTS